MISTRAKSRRFVRALAKANANRFDGWSDAEIEFFNRWRQLAMDAPEPEHDAGNIIPNRKHRADFLWRAARVIVEIEGGAYANGRHVRGVGYEGDCEKYDLLTVQGYRVLRFTPQMIRRDPHKYIAMVQSLVCPLQFSDSPDDDEIPECFGTHQVADIG